MSKVLIYSEEVDLHKDFCRILNISKSVELFYTNFFRKDQFCQQDIKLSSAFFDWNHFHRKTCNMLAIIWKVQKTLPWRSVSNSNHYLIYFNWLLYIVNLIGLLECRPHQTPFVFAFKKGKGFRYKDQGATASGHRSSRIGNPKYKCLFLPKQSTTWPSWIIYVKKVSVRAVILPTTPKLKTKKFFFRIFFLLVKMQETVSFLAWIKSSVKVFGRLEQMCY